MADNWLSVLVADLRGRGITFVLTGTRLKIRPWKLLTDVEATTVQANRPALKDLIRAEANAPTPVPAPEAVPEPVTVAPTVDRDAELRIIDPDTWAIVHPDSPEAAEAQRLQDAHQTAVMMRMVRFGRPDYF